MSFRLSIMWQYKHFVIGEPHDTLDNTLVNKSYILYRNYGLWRIHVALSFKGHFSNFEWIYMSKNTYCSIIISVKFGSTVMMLGLLFGIFCHLQNKWIYFSNQACSGCQVKEQTYNYGQTFCYESYIIPRWITFYDDTILSGSASHIIAGKPHSGIIAWNLALFLKGV